MDTESSFKVHPGVLSLTHELIRLRLAKQGVGVRRF
jgi:hypothetical protein